jgi:hypothetical protein
MMNVLVVRSSLLSKRPTSWHRLGGAVTAAPTPSGVQTLFSKNEAPSRLEINVHHGGMSIPGSRRRGGHTTGDLDLTVSKVLASQQQCFLHQQKLTATKQEPNIIIESTWRTPIELS